MSQVFLILIIFLGLDKIYKVLFGRRETDNFAQNVTEDKGGNPSTDVIEEIQLYKELKCKTIDKSERIRRCNNILIDFEWYSDHRNESNRRATAQANWQALWDAVIDSDIVYEGDKYPMDMMSNICLKIIEKNTPH